MSFAVIVVAAKFEDLIDPHLRKSDGAVLLLLLGVAALMMKTDSFYRHFAQLANIQLDDMSTIRFPREAKIEELSEDESVEMKEERERDEWDEHNKLPNADAGPSWRCSHCKEDNPASCEVCWKCQSARDG